jgi:AraC-like DNA-binding protein
MATLSARELRGIAESYVDECAVRRTAPQVNELARRLGMSAGDLSNLFLRLLGERPSAYFQRTRFDCAKRLLSTTDLTMDRIAQICGYGTTRTFYRRFKSSVGMTPQDFREQGHL